MHQWYVHTEHRPAGALAESLVPKFQSSLLRVSGFQISFPPSQSLPLRSEYLMFTLNQIDWIGASQLRSVTEIAPKSPFLCVPPILSVVFFLNQNINAFSVARSSEKAVNAFSSSTTFGRDTLNNNLIPRIPAWHRVQKILPVFFVFDIIFLFW